MRTIDRYHRFVGGHTVRSSRCNAQIPNANPTIAASSTEETVMPGIPHHRLDGARMPT